MENMQHEAQVHTIYNLNSYHFRLWDDLNRCKYRNKTERLIL